MGGYRRFGGWPGAHPPARRFAAGTKATPRRPGSRWPPKHRVRRDRIDRGANVAVCVGIVGHFLERHVVEALFTAFAKPTTRQLLAEPDPHLVTAVTTEFDAAESDLADLARRWGRGEIARVEWEAAREGFAARAQALRNRLGLLGLPVFDADDVVEHWEEMGLATRRAVLSAVFERIEVHRATIRGYDPERIRLVWRIPRMGEMPVGSAPPATRADAN